jgi:hypothetical protein
MLLGSVSTAKLAQPALSVREHGEHTFTEPPVVAPSLAPEGFVCGVNITRHQPRIEAMREVRRSPQL